MFFSWCQDGLDFLDLLAPHVLHLGVLAAPRVLHAGVSVFYCSSRVTLWANAGPSPRPILLHPMKHVMLVTQFESNIPPGGGQKNFSFRRVALLRVFGILHCVRTQ